MMSVHLETKKNAILNFKGPVVPVATPFDNDGNINTSQIEKYARILLENGSKGFFILGTTGEGYSLTLKEKIELIRAWREALNKITPPDYPKQRPISIVNISSTCVPEIHQLAAEVERLNFDGISLQPPIYYKNSSPDHLCNLRHLDFVWGTRDKKASSTPFRYYHIPSLTGELKFELEQFLQKGLEQIPQFAAIKFTDDNVSRFLRIHSRFGDKIKIFSGFDEAIVAKTVFGCEAAICPLFTLKQYSSQFSKICDAVQRNNLDEASRILQKLTEKSNELKKDGNFFLSLKLELNKELESCGLSFGNPREPIFIEDI